MKKVGVALAVVFILAALSVFVSAQDCFLPCTTAEECNGDQSCIAGCCVANNCQVLCTTNEECTLDHTCNGECCVPIPCTTGSDCPTPCVVPEGISPSAFLPVQCNFCQFGFCADPPCSTQGCSCTSNAGCEDSNPCTQDLCVGSPGSKTCNFTQLESDGTGCDLDSSDCTPDTCQSGACTAGTPVICSECQSCNPNNGNCGNDNNAQCSDGLFCTGVDSCMSGNCNPGTDPCDDNDMCTTDSCDEGQDSCTNTPVDCDDQDICTTDTCNPANGNCGHMNIQGCCTSDSDCNQNQCEECIANSCKDCSGGSDSDGDGFPASTC